jgi:fumarate reductase iron-sulfur subunit
MNAKERITGTSNPATDEPKITNLMRREIQAPIAACLIREYSRVLGAGMALETAADAVRGDALAAGRNMAEKFGGCSMKELGRVLRELWAEDGALEYRILEENERTLNFDVTRCRYAELFDRLDMKDIGAHLTCVRDEPFIAGFNPSIKFERTQTIMEGKEFCDFRFTMI